MKTSRTLFRAGLVLMWVVLMSGCASSRPDGALLKIPEISVKEAEALWGEVLQQAVDPEGRIDFEEVAKHPQALERYIAFIASVSPESRPDLFPGREQSLAFYLNSYNALAMYGVIQAEVTNGFDSLWARARFFKITKFVVGGEEISLLDYENKVIRPLGEPRVHFGLNCMVLSCPRLPQEPFQALKLEQQLQDASFEFFNDPRHIYLDRADKKVYVSAILDFYTEDFVNSFESYSLINFINRYRKSPVSESYSVDFIPYNWTLNRKTQ